MSEEEFIDRICQLCAESRIPSVKMIGILEQIQAGMTVDIAMQQNEYFRALRQAAKSQEPKNPPHL